MEERIEPPSRAQERLLSLVVSPERKELAIIFMYLHIEHMPGSKNSIYFNTDNQSIKVIISA